MNRRRFLFVAGAAIATVAVTARLAAARKVGKPVGPPTLQPWTLADEAPANPYETARALIGAAVLAPSEWNSQPWRFEADLAAVRLVADSARELPVTDPERRGLMISLGAALENLLIAARAYGLHPNVSYFPRENVVAEVMWTGGDVRRDHALFTAIPERRTNRREYEERGILPDERAQITAQVPEGYTLHWLDDRDAVHSVADLVGDAVHDQVSDRAAQREQFAWMRFGDDAERHGDGVPVDALEFGTITGWFAKRFFNPTSWLYRFGADRASHQARDAVRSTAALALLTANGRGAQPWLMGGQAFERVALQATHLKLAVHPLSAPIEVASRRPDLLRHFGAAGEEPLALLRLGHGRQLPATPRRSVALVTSFRNS